MLNEDEFQQWCEKQSLQRDTVEEVARIRSSDPSRRVTSAGRNVIGTFPSKKMGHMVHFESHQGELPRIYLFEIDEDVLEYWEQPPPIKISFLRKDGKNTAVFDTPDFFVIRKNSAGWEEVKDEERLQALAEKFPTRYVRSTAGEWRDLAGEDYASRLGLYYKVRSSSDINWTFQRNIQFLYDYINLPFEPDDDCVSLVNGLVYADNGINLYKLIELIKPSPPDVIYMMILNHLIYVDLHHQVLAEASNVRVFSDIEAFSIHEAERSKPIEIQSGSKVVWDGVDYRIANVSHEDVYLEEQKQGGCVKCLKTENFIALLRERKVSIISASPPAECYEIIKKASPADIKAANERYPKLRMILNGERSGKIDRTTYRHLEKFQLEQEANGQGYIALFPRNHDKGNRVPRLPEATIKVMDDVIKNAFLITTDPAAAAIYDELCARLTVEGLVAPSKPTFYKHIKAIPKERSTQLREGAKAAYKYEPEFLELEYTTPRHGDRPFEIAHIDHTKMDLEFVESDTGVVIDRLWLTLMMDAYSRRTLGIYLCYDPPSYRSLMMVFRDCVRRFGRLPATIIHDGGKEFRSIYFDSLLARFRIGRKIRPKSKPRSGNVLERIFGTINTRLLYNLSGNTQSSKRVRQMTKAVDPKKNAAWPLHEFYDRFEEWAFKIYDNRRHEALGQTPREAFDYRLDVTGTRTDRIVLYDEQFIMDTCPAPAKRTSKVIPGKGVKINGIYYYCEAFHSPGVEGKSFQTRYDPMNMGIAYVYINNRWQLCRSKYYALLAGKSEKYLCIAAVLARKRAAVRGEKNRYSPEEAAFYMSIKNEEKLLVQQRKDAEMATKVKEATPHISQDEDNVPQDEDLWGPRTPELLEDF